MPECLKRCKLSTFFCVERKVGTVSPRDGWVPPSRIAEEEKDGRSMSSWSSRTLPSSFCVLVSVVQTR